MQADRLLLHAEGAAFAVDAGGRVVWWNEAAKRLFGLGHEEVYGRKCCDILACRDLRERGSCPESCPVLDTPRADQPTTLDVLVQARGSTGLAVRANGILLQSAGPARALVMVRPSAWTFVGSTRAGPRAAPGAEAIAAWPAPPHVALARFLDHVLVTTGADAAELFLSAPQDDRLLLMAHSGEAPRAFRQMVCFERAQGFPGLVAQTSEPLVSFDLLHDDRYLRNEVKRRGFRFYLCVPVWSDSRVFGSLHITSRQHAEIISLGRSILEDLGHELGVVLELRRLRAAERVAHVALDPKVDAAASLQSVMHASLLALIEISASHCGALLIAEPQSAAPPHVIAQNVPPELTRRLACQWTFEQCPAIGRRRTIVPVDRGGMALGCCHAVRHDLPSALCVPFAVGDKPLGVVLLGCRHHDLLPTQHLSVLQTALERAALAIHNAQVMFQREQRARAAALEQARNSRDVRASANARPSEGDGDAPFLDLRSFGHFTIFCDGWPLPVERFARRRSLSLLKILLTRYGKQVHREELLDLLWPDADPQSARPLLNVTVHYLRRALEPHAPAGRPSSFIHSNGDHYSFNTQSPHRLDSQTFLDALRRGMQHESDGQRGEAITAYQHAIALYSGDFLEEERYSDWCALEREFLRESFLTTLRRMARLQIAAGDPDMAMACYRRALQADLTLEDVHRALMAALWQAGRRDEALRQYRECRTILARELGIAPMPETEALRQQILANSRLRR